MKIAQTVDLERAKEHHMARGIIKRLIAGRGSRFIKTDSSTTPPVNQQRKEASCLKN